MPVCELELSVRYEDLSTVNITAVKGSERMLSCDCSPPRWRARSSLLNLSLARDLDLLQHPLLDLPKSDGWSLEYSFMRLPGEKVKKRISVNRTGWVPTLTQTVHAWFHPPLIQPLPCSQSRGEDSVILRSFFQPGPAVPVLRRHRGTPTFLEARRRLRFEPLL